MRRKVNRQTKRRRSEHTGSAPSEDSVPTPSFASGITVREQLTDRGQPRTSCTVGREVTARTGTVLCDGASNLYGY